MSNIPANLKYTETHEWIEDLGDGTIRVGITDHAQELLGDMVYVELPEVGDTFEAGDECAVVESVKAASDVYSPVAGDIVEVNENLANSPDLVNQDSYNDGWLFVIKLSQPEEMDDLLDAETYEAKAAEDDDQ
jgi:glycine cleavage system H protein